VQVAEDDVRVVLLLHARRAALELVVDALRPPVLQVPIEIELTPLVVEAVVSTPLRTEDDEFMTELNACANSGRFDSGPLTRRFGGECGFVETRWRSASSLILPHQPCAKPRKNSCSGVNPPFAGAADVHVNGKLTLGENIADLGGIKLAYKAFKAQRSSSNAAPAAGVTATKDDFTPDQEFFLGFAQGWCGKMRDEALRHLVSTNPHSPPNFRVNGPLSNTPEFAQAFGCKPDAKMVKKDRCEVW